MVPPLLIHILNQLPASLQILILLLKLCNLFKVLVKFLILLVIHVHLSIFLILIVKFLLFELEAVLSEHIQKPVLYFDIHERFQPRPLMRIMHLSRQH